MSVRQTPLMQADDALVHYLDSLLREIPDAPAEEAAPAESPVVSPVESCPAVPEGPPGDSPAEFAGEPSPCGPETPGAGGNPHATGEAPAGAGPFKALLFDVDGITLAMPLDRLSGVVEWNGELNTIPGSSPHVLGVMDYQGRNARVIDAGHLIVGAEGATPGPRAGGYVVLLADGEYGLACDQIREMIDVDPAEVRWRRGGARRLWFAGIITDRMCALLEVDELNRYLTAPG